MNIDVSTRFSRRLGIEYPIFGFTHDAAVVAAISRSGGLGVYGAAYYSPDRVEQDLAWIAANTNGRPFGVDVMIPSTGAKVGTDADLAKTEAELAANIPSGHIDFVRGLLDRFGVGELPEGAHVDPVFPLGPSEAAARQHMAMALAAGASVVVSALGPAPRDCVDDLRSAGVLVGGMVGLPKHAESHLAVGADFVIAQGSEAAAHSGDVSTMVLLPQVVDRVAPVPVLAAGGISTGRQMLAARALGAEGIWSGSVWRTARECSESDQAKNHLLLAESDDTVKSKCMTGKPLRQLKSPWNGAWAEPGAPAPLPLPMQRILTANAEQRIAFYGRNELEVSPIGQTVGQLTVIRTASEILADYIAEYKSAAQSILATSTAQ
jgi:NAD(P)H-dependent flavin oxidoreductase YrpB (nitropropane dioxygenase family)